MEDEDEDNKRAEKATKKAEEKNKKREGHDAKFQKIDDKGIMKNFKSSRGCDQSSKIGGQNIKF